MSRRLICSCKFDTILSSPESPSFVGAVVSRKRHPILKAAKLRVFAVKRAKLSWAVACMAVSTAVMAALWPNARDAFAVLAAQDDPAELADLHLNSALRNNPRLVSDNIETALASGDADLAGSFAELAR